MLRRLAQIFARFKSSTRLTDVDAGSVMDTLAPDVDALILARGDTASLDYYVTPEVERRQLRWATLDTRSMPPSWSTEMSHIKVMVIVRYVPPAWCDFIQKAHQSGIRIVYFVDDDVLDERVVERLPRQYAKRVRRDALDQRALIERVSDEFWVSSQYLADKYQQWGAHVVRPKVTFSVQDATVWVCYHGTYETHRSEIDWLFSVMQQVQHNNDNTRFELSGDSSIYKRYRLMPRVSILHPMPWPNYLNYASSVKRDIGLVPLLPNEFNAARGPTKFFDMTRLGAVGIYSDVEPYSSFIRHGVDGFLLPNQAESWVELILSLSKDKELREQMLQAAQQRILDVSK